MKALLCQEPGSLLIVDRAEPQPAEGEVLVQIQRVGVCGTDYHIFHGRQPYLNYPRVMGHELAGTVLTAPAGSELECGQLVCIEPYIWCGECVACRRGKTNCCAHIGVLGVHRDGGMTSLIAVPARNVIPAPGLSLDQAAMVEFLAIGAHGVRRASVEAGQRVLVVGAGPIGIAAAIFAAERDALVTIIDTNLSRLDLCSQHLDVVRALAVDDGIDGALAAASDGDSFDVVIDATGSAAAMEHGFRYVAHGGAYVLLSIVRGSVTFDDPEFHKRETTLHASRNATRADFETVMAAIRGTRVPTHALATHRASLAEAAELIELWSRPEAGVVKALIEL